MKQKQLKVWNGRANGKYLHMRPTVSMYVAAYSQKQARELLELVCETRISSNEIKDYFSPCWGDPMQGIEAIEPCIFITIGHSKPIQVYPQTKTLTEKK